jgi:hypothetical protein
MRVTALEGELSVAAALLDLREQQKADEGSPRSPVVTELQQKWRALIDAEPAIEQEEETEAA